MRGISGLAGKPLGLQESVCCMEFYGQFLGYGSLRKNIKSHTAAEIKFLTAVKYIVMFA